MDQANPRLEELEARWEADKGSRVFLQLADEYRRHDRPADAVRVLDEGLERSPGHLGARVARARSLLDLGRTDDAVADLQRVIDADPTQMVAYRLLVEAHIERGDAEAAEESLRIYRMLNDADPAIDDLRRRIAGLGEGSDGETPEPGDVAEATEAEEADPEPHGEPDVDAEEADAPPAEVPFPEAEAAPGGPPAPPALAVGASEPFPALGSGADRRRYLESFEGDLFAPLPGEAPPFHRPELPAAESAPGTVEPVSIEAVDEPFDLGDAGAAPSSPDLLELEPPASEPRAEPVAEEPPAKAAEEPSAEPGPELDEDRPTVTLARLYQRQGHLEEAAEIFRRVLEREPEREEARRGLGEVEAEMERAAAEPPAAPSEPGPEAAPVPGPSAPELDTGELLAGYDPAEHGEGVTARKRYALGRYLDRIQGADQSRGDRRRSPEGRDVH